MRSGDHRYGRVTRLLRREYGMRRKAQVMGHEKLSVGGCAPFSADHGGPDKPVIACHQRRCNGRRLDMADV